MKYIPQELKSLNQWVVVKKNSKIPINANNDRASSSTDPQTWCEFKKANRLVEEHIYDDIGFVFNDNGIVGIDIDCGKDEDGFLSRVACDIINKCNSFTEWSRSGRGVHIYLKGILPFKGQNNGTGVEIYQSSRYFIVTGKSLLEKEIIYNQEAINYILEKYFNNERPRNEYDPNKDIIYSPIISKGKNTISISYPPINKGQRNISLLSYGCQLLSSGLNANSIYKELLKHNQKYCKPPLDDNEIRQIVKSVMKYDTKKI